MVSGCSGVKNLFHMEEVVGLKSDISGLKTELKVSLTQLYPLKNIKK